MWCKKDCRAVNAFDFPPAARAPKAPVPAGGDRRTLRARARGEFGGGQVPFPLYQR